MFSISNQTLCPPFVVVQKQWRMGLNHKVAPDIEAKIVKYKIS